MPDAPSDVDVGAWVRRQWDEADRSLFAERRNYWLNYAFVNGDQWVVWHPARKEVIEFTRPRGDDRVRLVCNRMMPSLVVLLARLTKRQLAFEVPATAPDDSTLAGARLAEHILEAHRVDDGWEELRREAIHAAFLGGTSAVCVEWDPNAGDELGADPETGRVVTGGAIRLAALSITEFTLEPGTRRWRDARWWISARQMPPAQVQAHWQLDRVPKGETHEATSPNARRVHAERGWANVVELTTVYTYYERPSKARPAGRDVVVAGDETVIDQPWPFPDNRLNLYPFRQFEQPNRWTGTTVLNDARPLQAAYNHGRSNLAEHMKRAGNARMAIPDTSGVDPDDLSDEPGEPILYDATSGGKPGWIEPPHLDRWLFQHVADLGREIDDILFVHDISRGQAPGDRNSGLALSLLAEKDETPLGLMAHDQAAGWAYLASFVLETLAERVVEHRTSVITTPDGVPLRREWTGRHLRDQTQVHVPLESTMPHSKAALQAWVMQLAQQFPSMHQAMAAHPHLLAKLLDLPAASMFGQVLNADVAQAEQENHLMSTGQIPSLGSDPYPMPWDDHGVHIAEHNRFRKSRAYIYGADDMRHIVDLHIEAHERLAFAEAADQRQLNDALPGGGAIPQADEPVGSAVPDDFAESLPGPMAVGGL